MKTVILISIFVLMSQTVCGGEDNYKASYFKVISGKVDNGKFSIVGRTLNARLSAIDEINNTEFIVDFVASPLYDSPVKIGANYIAELQNIGNGVYAPLNEFSSVIEVSEIKAERDDIEKILSRNFLEKNLLEFGGKYYYPTLCETGLNKKLCFDANEKLLELFSIIK